MEPLGVKRRRSADGHAHARTHGTHAPTHAHAHTPTRPHHEPASRESSRWLSRCPRRRGCAAACLAGRVHRAARESEHERRAGEDSDAQTTKESRATAHAGAWVKQSIEASSDRLNTFIACLRMTALLVACEYCERDHATKESDDVANYVT
jgi:hypothetical protein